MVALAQEPISIESSNTVELTEVGDTFPPVATALARMSREDREQMERMLTVQEIRRERIAA